MLLMAMFVVSPLSYANIAHNQTTSSGVIQNLSDMKLAGMIRSTIAFERRLSNEKITVQVRDSQVNVSGKLSTKREHDLLLSIINQIVGSDVRVSIQDLVLSYKKANVRF